jgi:hypothetical protein
LNSGAHFGYTHEVLTGEGRMGLGIFKKKKDELVASPNFSQTNSKKPQNLA